MKGAANIQADAALPDLAAVIEAARSGFGQPAIEWPRGRWERAFPRHRRLIAKLPARLSRDVAREACGDCPDTSQGAIEAFIASMAWGYGSAGYGCCRTAAVLAEGGADAGRTLAQARRLVVEEGPLAGYEHFTGPGRLKGLGPAFGTKFLFFQNEEALILDKLIADWFSAIDGTSLRPTIWSPHRYRRYLQTMGRWAEEAKLSSLALEEAAFTEIARARGSQWAPE